MKNLKISLIALTSVLLINCSNNEEQTEVAETPNAKVQYGYTENNLNNVYKIYTQNNLIDKVVYSNGYSEIFYYNSNNKIEKIEHLKPNNELLNKTEFYYNGNLLDYTIKNITGYNTKLKESLLHSAGSIDVTTETINLTTNNVISSTQSTISIVNENIISNSINNENIIYSYDGATNIYSNLSSLEELAFYYKNSNTIQLSKNNLLEIDSSNNNNDYTFINNYDNSNRIIERKKMKQNSLFYIEKIEYK